MPCNPQPFLDRVPVDASVRAVERRLRRDAHVGVAREAVELLRAKDSPSEVTTLVLDGEVVFSDHSRDDYCRTIVPADYDSEATSELWDDFLDKFVPSPGVRDYLQRCAGYSLLGANRELHRLRIRVGCGGRLRPRHIPPVPKRKKPDRSSPTC